MGYIESTLRLHWKEPTVRIGSHDCLVGTQRESFRPVFRYYTSITQPREIDDCSLRTMNRTEDGVKHREKLGAEGITGFGCSHTDRSDQSLVISSLGKDKRDNQQLAIYY